LYKLRHLVGSRLGHNNPLASVPSYLLTLAHFLENVIYALAGGLDVCQLGWCEEGGGWGHAVLLHGTHHG
jgi:hypothetical protein